MRSKGATGASRALRSGLLRWYQISLYGPYQASTQQKQRTQEEQFATEPVNSKELNGRWRKPSSYLSNVFVKLSKDALTNSSSKGSGTKPGSERQGGERELCLDMWLQCYNSIPEQEAAVPPWCVTRQITHVHVMPRLTSFSP